MLTAREARDKVNSIEHGVNKAELATIALAIESAVSKGSDSVAVSKITEPNQQHLRSLGYKVTYDNGGDQRDPYPSYYRISW